LDMNKLTREEALRRWKSFTRIGPLMFVKMNG